MRKYVDEITFDNLLSSKKDNSTIITTIESPLTLQNNTEYYLSDISSLELLYPNNKFEVWMKISFSSTEPISVTFPTGTKYIGTTPSFSNGQTWEISIKDGVAICWRIE